MPSFWERGRETEREGECGERQGKKGEGGGNGRGERGGRRGKNSRSTGEGAEEGESEKEGGALAAALGIQILFSMRCVSSRKVLRKAA